MSEAEVKKDTFTATLDAAIPAAEARAKAGDLSGAVEDLLTLEKKTRAAGDAFATSKLVVAVVKMCFEARDFKQLNAQILVISKRRGQLKQAISDTVQVVMGFLESTPTKADKVELITTLRTVTEGKMYVEVERARVTKMLAEIYEADGQVNEASDVLQEVQVETFGSMEKKEKAKFLLEQIRLTLRQRDFVRTGILANKVNKKVLDEEGFEEIRLRFYDLMALLAHGKHETVALCKGYMTVLQTRGFKDDASKWRPVLASAILCAALSPFDNEVSDLLHRLKADTRTEELPAYAALLKFLTTPELVSWPLPSPYNEILSTHPLFLLDPNAIGAPGGAGGGIPPASDAASSGDENAPYSVLDPGRVSSSGFGAAASSFGIGGGGSSGGSSNVMAVETTAPVSPLLVSPFATAASNLTSSTTATSSSSSSTITAGGIVIRPAGALKSTVVTKEDEPRATWWPVFQKRIVQHNIRVMAGAYTRVKFVRLCELLTIDAPTTEAMVSELVSEKSIYARIDRPAGIVVFERPRPPTEVLSDWGADVESILSLVEKTTHLIQKEYMVHGVVA